MSEQCGNDEEEASRLVQIAIPVEPLSSETGNSCRICMEGDSTAANPLISPCRCSGGTRNVIYNVYMFQPQRITPGDEVQSVSAPNGVTMGLPQASARERASITA
ncbi:hypothetical protein TSOC_010412 [Tetrabaena socialis]|uniref:RING-CH-type domain-containing protein n=1 Tax=Tetrabaena socialis TaxID=47790 RepID=A0A2J7ZTD0_9CHLO|nr:hypothetical protein TSOC_010412 [Tetrabaena socialis]|eukprot:PNH03526.1 hypothetical protein TSOC_010412 [Tetrabaena socialis]